MFQMRVTCKYFSVEPLNPVGADVEAEEVLEAVEGPDSDLGEEVVGEVQLPQPDLTLELVPAETPEGVPSNRRRSVEVSRGQSRSVQAGYGAGHYLEKLMLASCG